MSDHRPEAEGRRAAKKGRRARRAVDDGGPPPGDDAPNGDPSPDQSRTKNRLSVGAWIGIALTGVMVAATLGGYKIYYDLDSSIGRIPVDLGPDRPPETGALNVLVVGSDSRESAENKKYGQTTLGERTDTIILLHLSPNRDKATLLSFPRDSMVQVPACKHPKTGVTVPAGLKQINAAFNEGGIACTWATIESLTKIRINHFVKVDFSGFKGIVDALGGIDICLPKDVFDQKAKLDLKKGEQTVMGETALAYVRARYALGDGSDTDRIKRQQVFLTQVMKKATSTALLTDLGKLGDFLDAATASVTMDSELSVARLGEIAGSAKSLTEKGLESVTVPWKPYAPKPAQIEWRQPDADRLFAAIRSDTEVLPTAAPNAPAKPAIKNEQVRVQVFNGTDTDGRAREAADGLAEQGFVVTHVGGARPATGNVPVTTLRYAKNDTEGTAYGDVVAARLSGDKRVPVAGKVKPLSVEAYVPAKPVAEAPTGPIIQLVIGADWPGVRVLNKIPVSLKDQVIDSNTNPCG
ncbi:LCP family protein [Streptosporangium subroseum]|uniref:LCP family protein n=1 Tax=Streptosporangium subroseum TaxID=106412 RepID=UPI000B78B7BF|nr:LCP family protein [Streptosporangium subroseum]